MLYVAFSKFLQVTDFPPTARHLLRFAEFLLRAYRSHKSVTNALASVHTFSLQCGLDTRAFGDYTLALWKRALPATVRHVPHQATAMPTALLDKLCTLSAALGRVGTVFAALLSLAFASLARLSSLVSETAVGYDSSRLPVLQDLLIQGEVVLLRLKWGKCHQDAASGYWVPMLEVKGAPSCPLSNARTLLSLLSRRGPNTPLFTLPGGHGHNWFTMRTAREYLTALLAVAGQGATRYTFHSLRRGACTLAFSRGAVLTELQQLGGWRSDAVAAYYPACQARLRAARCVAHRIN